MLSKCRGFPRITFCLISTTKHHSTSWLINSYIKSLKTLLLILWKLRWSFKLEYINQTGSKNLLLKNQDYDYQPNARINYHCYLLGSTLDVGLGRKETHTTQNIPLQKYTFLSRDICGQQQRELSLLLDTEAGVNSKQTCRVLQF